MATKHPIFKGAKYGITVADNANVFDTDLTPTEEISSFLIYYHGLYQNRIRVKRTNSGTTVYEQLHTDNTNTWPYIFQIIVAPGDSINITNYSSGGTVPINTIIVVEVDVPVGAYARGQSPFY